MVNLEVPYSTGDRTGSLWVDSSTNILDWTWLEALEAVVPTSLVMAHHRAPTGSVCRAWPANWRRPVTAIYNIHQLLVAFSSPHWLFLESRFPGHCKSTAFRGTLFDMRQPVLCSALLGMHTWHIQYVFSTRLQFPPGRSQNIEDTFTNKFTVHLTCVVALV